MSARHSLPYLSLGHLHAQNHSSCTRVYPSTITGTFCNPCINTTFCYILLESSVFNFFSNASFVFSLGLALSQEAIELVGVILGSLVTTKIPITVIFTFRLSRLRGIIILIVESRSRRSRLCRTRTSTEYHVVTR